MAYEKPAHTLSRIDKAWKPFSNRCRLWMESRCLIAGEGAHRYPLNALPRLGYRAKEDRTVWEAIKISGARRWGNFQR